MRIQGAKKVHYDSGPNMTPLVDVVMVILIFLMLAGSFGATEHYIVSSMPLVHKSAGERPHTDVPDDPQMEILVNSAGGTFAAHAGGHADVYSGEELKTQLVEMKMQLSGGNVGEFDKDTKTQVVINPGQSVKWQFLIDVYQAALEAGFTKVGFSTAHN